MSILLGDSTNLREGFGIKMHQYLNWLPKIEGISLQLKTRSGSYSGLDKSIQAKKKTYQSHATVPLEKG